MEIKNRDCARLAFKNAGITTENITKNQLSDLRKSINKKMIESGNYNNTYRMRQSVSKFMFCKTELWENREAISFNRDGFIGIAGWADCGNVKPILDGIADFLEQQIKTGISGGQVKQIREIGSYLITIYDASDHEVREIVSNVGLLETVTLAKAELSEGESFTIAKIIENSKYNKWGVK